MGIPSRSAAYRRGLGRNNSDSDEWDGRRPWPVIIDLGAESGNNDDGTADASSAAAGNGSNNANTNTNTNANANANGPRDASAMNNNARGTSLGTERSRVRTNQDAVAAMRERAAVLAAARATAALTAPTTTTAAGTAPQTGWAHTAWVFPEANVFPPTLAPMRVGPPAPAASNRPTPTSTSPSTAAPTRTEASTMRRTSLTPGATRPFGWPPPSPATEMLERLYTELWDSVNNRDVDGEVDMDTPPPPRRPPMTIEIRPFPGDEHLARAFASASAAPAQLAATGSPSTTTGSDSTAAAATAANHGPASATPDLQAVRSARLSLMEQSLNTFATRRLRSEPEPQVPAFNPEEQVQMLLYLAGELSQRMEGGATASRTPGGAVPVDGPEAVLSPPLETSASNSTPASASTSNSAAATPSSSLTSGSAATTTPSVSPATSSVPAPDPASNSHSAASGSSTPRSTAASTPSARSTSTSTASNSPTSDGASGPTAPFRVFQRLNNFEGTMTLGAGDSEDSLDTESDESDADMHPEVRAYSRAQRAAARRPSNWASANPMDALARLQPRILGSVATPAFLSRSVTAVATTPAASDAPSGALALTPALPGLHDMPPVMRTALPTDVERRLSPESRLERLQRRQATVLAEMNGMRLRLEQHFGTVDPDSVVSAPATPSWASGSGIASVSASDASTPTASASALTATSATPTGPDSAGDLARARELLNRLTPVPAPSGERPARRRRLNETESESTTPSSPATTQIRILPNGTTFIGPPSPSPSLGPQWLQPVTMELDEVDPGTELARSRERENMEAEMARITRGMERPNAEVAIINSEVADAREQLRLRQLQLERNERNGERGGGQVENASEQTNEGGQSEDAGGQIENGAWESAYRHIDRLYRRN